MIKNKKWQRNLLCFLLGVFATFTLAPFYIFPFIIPAYGGLFLLVKNAATRKRAFADGWWWGWGFYISGLYWFCIALLTDPEKFGWAIPFCLLGLNAIIAFYPAVACFLFNYLVRNTSNIKRKTVIDLLAFSTIWLLVEYARGHLFSGFPWNLAGYSFGFSAASLQLASVLGAYGLTFFTVLLGAAVAVIRSNRIFVFCIWGLFAVALFWGNMRLQNVPEAENTSVKLRLVQGNIKQNLKWDPQLMQKNLGEYVTLTQSAGIENVGYVIWPETAVPFPLKTQTPLTYHLGASMPPGVMLVTGGMRIEGDGDDSSFYNSVMAIANDGKIIGNYDKHSLVPFGEFFPMRFLVPKSIKLPVGDKDFSAGSGPQTMIWGELPPVSVLVCYEAIFPEFAVDSDNRPQWLLNVTNDAWFGMSSGPYQHFEMARMRAVEQGLPLVRVANTGITAYIDEYGRIKQHLGLGEQGILDVKLQKTRLDSTTYTRYGQGFLIITLCFAAGLLIYYRKLMVN